MLSIDSFCATSTIISLPNQYILNFVFQFYVYFVSSSLSKQLRLRCNYFWHSVAIYTRIYIYTDTIYTYIHVCTYICIWAHTHILYYVSYVNWQKYGHCFRFVYLVRIHEVIYWARNYILYRAKYLQLP